MLHKEILSRVHMSRETGESRALPTSKSVVIITICELMPASHEVVKRAIAPPTGRLVLITTLCELTVMGVVVMLVLEE